MSILDLELTDGKRLGIAATTVISIVEAGPDTSTICTTYWPDGLTVRGHIDEVMGEWWAAIGMWMVCEEGEVEEE